MAVSSACAQMSTTWTGSRADALRQAMHMAKESFADYLGISARTVAYWRAKPYVVPQQEKQDILDTALRRASDGAKERFAFLTGAQNDSPGIVPRQFTYRGTTRDDACASADAGDAVILLDDLASADMTDLPEVTQGRWVPGSTPSVIADYLFASPAWQHQEEPLILAPNTAAARIRATAKHLMDIDFQFGGGYVRRMLLFYFRSEIVPLLREPNPEDVRSGIFGAAAEVAQLLGWSAYDAGRHAAAQRYFLRGLRLAQEAEDDVLGGRLLSNLSHQANYLGRFDEALQFARAAQASARGRASDTVMAMFLAMEARALASSGEARMCAQALHLAEQAFARRDLSKDPQWIGYFDELELAGEAAHCFRELGQPRETQLFAVRAIDPVATPARTRAFINMVTAAGAFKAGNLDEALAYASDSVSMTSTLQSSRYVRYLTDFHGSVTEKQSANPTVREFTELVTRTYPALKLRGLS
jgi:tetratricopeptide (TPR) repeat protein/transcriptional regulator with XRE-family HTH domain